MFNPIQLQKRLVMRCSFMYGGIGLIVIVGMLLSNKFVSHASSTQFQSTLIGIAAGYALLLFLLVSFTAYSLSATKMGGSCASQNMQQRKQAIWLRLTSFPSDFFWFYWVIGFMLAQTYRMLTNGLPPWYGEVAISAWKGVLFDSSTFLAFAMIHYCLLRWLLHQELKGLELVRLTQPRFHRMTIRIIIIVSCGFFYLTLRLFWYVYQGVRTESSVNWGIFMAIAAVVIVVTFIALNIAASYLIKDMKRIEDRLLQLSVFSFESASTMKPIAVVSPYEAGKLALAFNDLQHRFSREYTRLQDEIQLAYSVQQQLFPVMKLQIGNWTIKGSYVQEEGNRGCFFHLTTRNDQQAAFIAGTLNISGPSASLIMSSLLMLFRTQVELHISSELMLHRLYQQLVHVLAEGMELHIAIMTLDAEKKRLEWALAGHMRIKLFTYNDDCTIVTNGTLPLSSSIMTTFSSGQQVLDHMKEFQLEYPEQVTNFDNDEKDRAGHDISFVPLVIGQCEVNIE